MSSYSADLVNVTVTMHLTRNQYYTALDIVPMLLTQISI